MRVSRSDSLRFFKGIDNPASFQPGASDASDLTRPNARHTITYYFVPQLENPVHAYKTQQVLQPPSANLNALIAALSGTASDPMNLIVRFRGSGHAITPYAVEERGNHFEVWVYNSNTPNVASTVLITTTNESWSYNMGSLGIWSGNASTKSLGVIPISQSALPMVCPWCLLTSSPGAQPQSVGNRSRRRRYDRSDSVAQQPDAAPVSAAQRALSGFALEALSKS